MIAITPDTRRTMYSKGGTETYTSNIYSASDTTTTCVVVVDDGWKSVTVDDLAAIKIKEPAQQEQDEPNTDERSVIWERPNRRLATVNRAGRTDYPRKAASTWG